MEAIDVVSSASNNDVRHKVAEDTTIEFCGDGGEIHGLVSWLDEIDGNASILRPEQTNWQLEYPGVVFRRAHSADSLRTVAAIDPEVLDAAKNTIGQRLRVFDVEWIVVALQMKPAIRVIARVRVPISVTARLEQIDIARRRAANPKRQPQIGTVPNDGVSEFIRDAAELHPADLLDGLTTRRIFIEEPAPLRELLGREAGRVNGLGLKPVLEGLEIRLS